MAQWFETDLKAAEVGYHLSLRARVALDIVRHNAMVAGDVDGEDSQGRSKGRLQTPAEAAERAVLIADVMVNEFERRDWVRECPMSAEDAAQRIGELQRIRHDAEYKKLSDMLDKKL